MIFETIPQVVDSIYDVSNSFEKFFIPKEIDYIDMYCSYVMRNVKKGTFDESNREKLKKMDWNKYNIRHGISSIIGTLGEIIATGGLNQYASGGGTSYRMAPDDKKTQMAGIDQHVYNPKWKDRRTGELIAFTGQTKVSNHKLIGPDLSKTKADRLIVVDCSNQAIMMCGLPEFKQALANSGQSKISISDLRSANIRNLHLSVNKYTLTP